MTSPAVAHAALQHALAGAAANAQHVPCAGRDAALWTSDDPDERALAAELCTGCPVLSECALAAESTNEEWHVWAGVDRKAAANARRRRASPPKRHPPEPTDTTRSRA